MALNTLPLGGCSLLYDSLGGAFQRQPWEMQGNLSPGAEQLLAQAFSGIDPDALADVHVHLISSEVSPQWLSPWRPVLRGRLRVYLSAAGVAWNDTLEQDYFDRLIALAEAFPIRGRFFLYALDYCCHRDGHIDHEQTLLHVDNEAVIRAAADRPDLVVPVVSVHPYRPDAVEQLHAFADRGVRYVKWLPNTMGINPSHELTEPFYHAMRLRDMVLLTHTGHEAAIEAVDQNLGNPLLLRKPLDMGVTVVALHAAADGDDIDLEHPKRPEVPSVDLFLRLMNDDRYEHLLYGEISTITFARQLDRPLRLLLERDDLHERWVNGSDYPLCAVNAAISTSKLVRCGFITHEQASQLEEIYDFNPLLYDFVIKRTVRHPDTGRQLPAELFHLPPRLQPW